MEVAPIDGRFILFPKLRVGREGLVLSFFLFLFFGSGVEGSLVMKHLMGTQAAVAGRIIRQPGWGPTFLAAGGQVEWREAKT